MWHDFQLIFDQITGKRNIFGYKKTSINQIHLMYWFLGEFCRSDIFDKTTTLVMILFIVGNFLIIFAISSSYMFLTSTREYEYSKILLVIELSAITIHSMIFLPMIACISRKHTSEVFKILDQDNQVELDDISSIPQSAKNKFEEKREKYSYNSKVIAVQLCITSLATILLYFDLIYQYNTEKLKNAEYYMYPVYCDQVDNLGMFSVLLIFEMVSVLPIVAMAFLLPIFSLTVTGEFYSKFQILCESLNYQCELFSNRIESNLTSKGSRKDTSSVQNIFIQNIHDAAKCHMRLLSGIHHLKSYFEHMMSISAIMFFVVEVVLIFLTIHVDEKSSLIQKMKLLCYASGISIIIFVNCLVGKLFTDMGQMFNDAVYGSPWYYLSPSRRKSVYLLLYQAQVPIEFKAIKIFPKNMAFLLRLGRYVYSFVNMLRFTFALRDS